MMLWMAGGGLLVGRQIVRGTTHLDAFLWCACVYSTYYVTAAQHTPVVYTHSQEAG
jgi:hypothetical protein